MQCDSEAVLGAGGSDDEEFMQDGRELDDSDDAVVMDLSTQWSRGREEAAAEAAGQAEAGDQKHQHGHQTGWLKQGTVTITADMFQTDMHV
jgi:hypothetical protein